jgi:hypothetical protein
LCIWQIINILTTITKSKYCDPTIHMYNSVFNSWNALTCVCNNNWKRANWFPFNYDTCRKHKLKYIELITSFHIREIHCMSKYNSSLHGASCQGAENHDQGRDPQPRKYKWNEWMQENNLVNYLGNPDQRQNCKPIVQSEGKRVNYS